MVLKQTYITLITSFLLMFLYSNLGLAQIYNFKIFGIEEGLGQSGVYGIMEDHMGYLWFGTEGGGVSRFDGKNFSTYTREHGLSGNIVRDIFQDSSHRIWFATQDGGVSFFDGYKISAFNQISKMIGKHIRSISEDNSGNLWFCSFQNGVVKYDGRSFFHYTTENLLPSNTVRVSLKDKTGNLWLGTDNGLVKMYEDKVVVYNSLYGLPDNRILCLSEDSSGVVWVGTGSGMGKMVNGKFHEFTFPETMDKPRVRSISFGNRNEMWLGTRKGAIRCRLNPNGVTANSWRLFTTNNGLSNNRIRCIKRDKSGGIWLGTFFGGVVRFSGDAFVHLRELPNPVVTDLFFDDEKMFISTIEGLCSFETGKEKISTYSSLAEVEITGIEKGYKPNELFLGTNGLGVILFNTKKDKLKRKIDIYSSDFQLPSNNVSYLLKSSKNDLWIATDRGLTYADENEDAFRLFIESDGLPDQRVNCMVEDSTGRIFVGTEKGIAIGISDSAGFIQHFSRPKWGKILTGIGISCMDFDQNGALWIGTRENGLFRYYNNELNLVREDLKNTNIRSVFFADDVLWVGTQRGMKRIEIDFESSIASIYSYDQNEGFTGIETNPHACLNDSKGRVWFGTIRGATIHDPYTKVSTGIPPSMLITSVKLFFEEPDWSVYSDSIAPFSNQPQTLTLPYYKNHLSFEFVGIHLKDPEKVNYMFMLEGYDEDWSPITNKQDITYSNLPWGDYSFKVMSSDGNGVWNAGATSFSFSINPALWQKTGFRISSICALVVMVFGFFLWRTRRLKQEKMKLEKIVLDRTKELRKEQEKSESLILNILPGKTAEELKTKGFTNAREYDMVSVMFTDFKGFTMISENIEPGELVHELNSCFNKFDDITIKYGIEKIKTIGDSYMCAGGLPEPNKVHSVQCILAGLEMLLYIRELQESAKHQNKPCWDVRIGIHTGRVVAGVVGKRKFAYDIWGDTVNTAARMESSGTPGRLNISETTFEVAGVFFDCEPRGKIAAKNKGMLDMYYVNRIKKEFSKDEAGTQPSDQFMAMIDSSILVEKPISKN